MAVPVGALLGTGHWGRSATSSPRDREAGLPCVWPGHTCIAEEPLLLSSWEAGLVCHVPWSCSLEGLFPGLAIAAAPILQKWPPCLQSNRLLLSVVSSYETGLVVLTNRKTEQAQDRIRTARKKNLDCIRKET